MAELDMSFEVVENDEEELVAERMNKKVRCWLGTWNNPYETCEQFGERLRDWWLSDLLQYAVFQLEQAPTTGTPHIQFFINLKTARTFKWLKEKLPKEAHFKPMRSTKTACRNYCMKPDTRLSETYYEIGEFVEERERTDLAKILDLANNGTSFEKIAQIYPTQCVMYKRQITDFINTKHNADNRRRFRDVKVTYIYGEAGVGKTSYVYKNHDFDDIFTVDMYDNSMFTHYDNQDVLLLDEFTGKIDITYLNKLLDRYPVQLRGLQVVKYAGYTQVYIISNKRLEDLYIGIQEQQPAIWRALLRRIGRIIYFDKCGVMHIKKDIYNHSVQESLPFDDDNNDDDVLFGDK